MTTANIRPIKKRHLLGSLIKNQFLLYKVVIMILESLLTLLSENPTAGVQLRLPDGNFVPSHFHITEVGLVRKDFIDCGGTVRSSASCVLQVWVAQDTHHRLDTSKLSKIIGLAAPLLMSSELPVEVEYEGGVLSQYPVTASEITPLGVLLHLGTKHTACLAPELCVIGGNQSNCGTPGCC